MVEGRRVAGVVKAISGTIHEIHLHGGNVHKDVNIVHSGPDQIQDWSLVSPGEEGHLLDIGQYDPIVEGRVYRIPDFDL